MNKVLSLGLILAIAPTSMAIASPTGFGPEPAPEQIPFPMPKKKNMAPQPRPQPNPAPRGRKQQRPVVRRGGPSNVNVNVKSSDVDNNSAVNNGSADSYNSSSNTVIYENGGANHKSTYLNFEGVGGYFNAPYSGLGSISCPHGSYGANSYVNESGDFGFLFGYRGVLGGSTCRKAQLFNLCLSLENAGYKLKDDKKGRNKCDKFEKIEQVVEEPVAPIVKPIIPEPWESPNIDKPNQPAGPLPGLG